MPDNLDLNPFQSTFVRLTDQQKAQLFYQSQQGDQQALQTVAKSYGDIVEVIILQLQDKNITKKHTFTYLFDNCQEVLKSLITRFHRFEDFDQKVVWGIRQNIFQKLS